MGKNSAIEWTNNTFNPWLGCTKVSPGCDHCYAEAQTKHFRQCGWGDKADRRQTSAANWKKPLAWNKKAARSGTRTRVFCASMADVFEDNPQVDGLRQRLWDLIARTPALDWQLLTKRPHNVSRMVPWTDVWPKNVWLGATAEDQKWLDKRLPHLLALRARVLFLSCEPLLGPIDLTRWVEGARRGTHRQIDWVIAGGESGAGARPMHPEWLTGVRDQCIGAGIKFHFKQWGNWRPVPAGTSTTGRTGTLLSSKGKQITVENMGKKKAGRHLQGRTWDEFPR
jgi:protein gp37